MFKRVIWMGVGAAAGSASTVWAQRKVKTQIERVASKATPSAAVNLAKNKASTMAGSLAAAVEEGRNVRRSTEAELRQNVEQRWQRSPAKSARGQGSGRSRRSDRR